MRTSGRTDGESVRSVEKAGALLFALAAGDEDGRLGTDLATATGISKPAAYRILRALERINIVSRDEDSGRYTIGIGIREIAAATGWHGRLRRAALPEMLRLRKTTAETVSLYAPRNAVEVICIETLSSNLSIRYEEAIGRRLQVARGATGTVLLADRAQHDGIEAVTAFLQNIDESELPGGGVETVLARLAEVRDVFCSTVGERVPGSAAISAPIRRPGQRAIGALTISGPVQRFSETAIAEGKRALLEAVSRIAAELA